MERKQFTFYSSFRDAIKRIRKKADRADAYDAIVEYALTGTEPDLDSMPDAAAMAFIMAKPSLDASRRKAEVGAKGGKNNPEANAKQGETASKAEANRKQDKEQEKEKDKDKDKDKEQMLKERVKREKPEASQASISFDRFWAAYPKKVGKGDARKAWEKVVAGMRSGQIARATVEDLIAAVERQKQSDQWQRDDGRYIPNPATWLNQGRWEDELRQASGGIQQHGAEMSPTMRAAVDRMMAWEEDQDEQAV